MIEHRPRTTSPIEALVVADLRGESTPRESQSLRDEHLNEWVKVLTILATDADAQFSASNERLQVARARSFSEGTPEARAEYERVKAEQHSWRKRTNRYKASIVARLAEAKLLVKERNQANQQEGRDEKFRQLATAVMEHRRQVNAEYDATELDTVLWNTLDRLLAS